MCPQYLCLRYMCLGRTLGVTRLEYCDYTIPECLRRTDDELTDGQADKIEHLFLPGKLVDRNFKIHNI